LTEKKRFLICVLFVFKNNNGAESPGAIFKVSLFVLGLN